MSPTNSPSVCSLVCDVPTNDDDNGNGHVLTLFCLDNTKNRQYYIYGTYIHTTRIDILQYHHENLQHDSPFRPFAKCRILDHGLGHNSSAAGVANYSDPIQQQQQQQFSFFFLDETTTATTAVVLDA
jgi:hypothetical protein